jgi:hypothetical protein
MKGGFNASTCTLLFNTLSAGPIAGLSMGQPAQFNQKQSIDTQRIFVEAKTDN